MHSYLKEFRLPLEKEQQAIPQNQSFQHDRSYSTNCYSSQCKRRTIQELLKQQIHHNKAFKSVIGSINNSPTKDNYVSSPSSTINQTQFNKTFNQESQSPPASRKMFVIVTDFNNKHYKIISSTNKEDPSERKSSQASYSDEKGGLLSNLKLKQAFVGNIHFPHEEEKGFVGNLQDHDKVRPMTMMNYLEKKRGGTICQSNSPPQSRKYKFNSTVRDSSSIRQSTSSSMNDTFLKNHVSFQTNLSSSLNYTAASQFPAKMPVKTRKYRLRKEDIIDKVVLEQRKRECSQVQEKFRSQTQYTQNDYTSINGGEHPYDNVVNSSSINSNQYEAQTSPTFPCTNDLICKGMRPYSHQSSPMTKRERYAKMNNKSVLLSRDSVISNGNNNSNSHSNNNNNSHSNNNNELNGPSVVSRERINSSQMQAKIPQNQLILTPERISLPKTKTKEQYQSDTKDTKKVYIDLKAKQYRSNSTSVQEKQEKDQRAPQTPILQGYAGSSSLSQRNSDIQNNESRLSNGNQGGELYPSYLKSIQGSANRNQVESPQQDFLSPSPIQPRYKPIQKQDQVKYKFYNQFYKQPQIASLINEFQSQEYEKQEMMITMNANNNNNNNNSNNNNSNNNQYNYFSYNKIFN